MKKKITEYSQEIQVISNHEERVRQLKDVMQNNWLRVFKVANVMKELKKKITVEGVVLDQKKLKTHNN